MVRKGQGSSEYLIVLAAVLIVALVAIMLIGAFPAFGADAKFSESTQYWRGTARPFAILEHTQQNDTLSFAMQNQETDRYIVTNITITNYNGSTVYANGVTMGGGARKVFNITGLPNCDPESYDEYEYEITIVYNTSNIRRWQIGGKPLMGKCV